jgi:hypothetical protein
VARLAFLALSAASRRVIVVIHHLAVDGVSWRTLLDDLTTICRDGERDLAPSGLFAD